MLWVREESTGTDLALDRLLGSGAEGSAYLARGGGRVVKLLAANGADDSRSHKVRLFTELAKSGRLPKEGFCWPLGQVLDRQTGRWVGYYMEPAEGSSLLSMLDDRSLERIPLRRRVRAGAKLSRNVEAFHSTVAVGLHAMAMPDFAAGNLLWDPFSGRLAVIDTDSFACRFRGPRGFVVDRGTARTPGYTPPECLGDNGEAAGPSSDEFALAVLLFEIVFGRSPTELKPGPGIAEPDADEAVLKGRYPCYALNIPEPPTYAVEARDVPDELHALWLRAFLDSKEYRPTASDWAVEFQRWSNALDRPLQISKRGWALAGAAALSLAATTAAWAVFHAGGDPSGAAAQPAKSSPNADPAATESKTPPKRFGNELLREVFK